MGHGCDLGGASGGTILLVLGCDKIGAIWDWGWWCDLGLGPMVLQAARSLQVLGGGAISAVF